MNRAAPSPGGLHFRHSGMLLAGIQKSVADNLDSRVRGNDGLEDFLREYHNWNWKYHISPKGLWNVYFAGSATSFW